MAKLSDKRKEAAKGAAKAGIAKPAAPKTPANGTLEAATETVAPERPDAVTPVA